MPIRIRVQLRAMAAAALLAAAGCVSPACAGAAGHDAPRTAGGDGLDQKRIHQQYNDGDFDAVTNTLEAFRRRVPNCSRADSIFIAKHLAVVYSANPTTREKGKYYMNQLLELLPSAKLVDMYVSDEIDRIFDKVREEFLSRQQSFGVDTAQIRTPKTAPSSEPARVTRREPPAPAKIAKRDEGAHTAYWVAGGAALMAAGVGAYFLMNSSQPKDKVYVVNPGP